MSSNRTERRSSWMQTFDSLDADKSGYIDIQELKAGLNALGQPSSDEDIEILLKAEGLDSNKDSCEIDSETFLRVVGYNEEEEKPLDKASLLDMFRIIDLDASEYITVAEMQHFLGNIGMFLTDEKMSQLVRMYDDSGDGRITFDEFVEIVADLGFSINRDSFTEDYIQVEEEKDAEEEKAIDKCDVPKNDGYVHKFFSLSIIADEDLKRALAPFDKNGDGTIDLGEVQQAAEGNIPPKLHWSDDRPKVGLAEHIKSVNHIAILVSDVAKSTHFYRNIIGLEQIRRPNFDSHGAWFTMGNVELHLIKGKPVVHEGDDLVVGHISIDAENVAGVLLKLQKMNVAFRKNTSVPAGADAGSMNTNKNNDMMSSKIVTQFFIRDPDGYYLEICNCDETLTKYCLGDKEDLAGYEEGIKPLSLAAASTTLNLMQRWVAKLDALKDELTDLNSKVKGTDGSIKEVAALMNCVPADKVDEALLQIMMDRRSIYGDVCQNEEEEDMEEIIRFSGNNARIAETIIKLRETYRGKTIFRPPAVFDENGMKYMPPVIIREHKE